MSERGVAAEPKTAQENEIDFLKGELRHFKSSGIIEVAVRNPSVKEYMEHWEGRALKAEARCAELEKAIDEFSTIALSLPTYPRPGVGGQTTEETAKATLIRGVSVWQVETLLSTLQGQDNGR